MCIRSRGAAVIWITLLACHMPVTKADFLFTCEGSGPAKAGSLTPSSNDNGSSNLSKSSDAQHSSLLSGAAVPPPFYYIRSTGGGAGGSSSSSSSAGSSASSPAGTQPSTAAQSSTGGVHTASVCKGDPPLRPARDGRWVSAGTISKRQHNGQKAWRDASGSWGGWESPWAV